MMAVRPFAKVQPSSHERYRAASILAGAVVIVGASFNAVVGGGDASAAAVPVRCRSVQPGSEDARVS